ncbi:MAG: hypothetical protein Q4F23_00100 [Coriobacteriia bacterium]|nr:hypothetical protein [Coriobacteriia bacterium]
MANRIGARFFRELAIAHGEMVEGSFVPYGPYRMLERRYVLAERLVREGRLEEAVAVIPDVARRTRPDEQDDFWSCESC